MADSSSIFFDKTNAEFGLDMVASPSDAFEYVERCAQVARESLVLDLRPEPDNRSTSSTTATNIKTATQQVRANPLGYRPPPWKSKKSQLNIFTSLQAWEGVVESIEGNDIVVRLFDLTNRDGVEVVTSFSKLELDDEEVKLATPGAIFYWSVGYSQSASGRRRESTIRFRRLPMWTREEIARGKAVAMRLCEKFGDEKDGCSEKHGT